MGFHESLWNARMFSGFFSLLAGKIGSHSTTESQAQQPESALPLTARIFPFRTIERACSKAPFVLANTFPSESHNSR